MIDYYLDDPIFPYFPSNSTSPKQQNHVQIKSYIHDDLSSLNEQHQPMLLMDERDLNS